MGYPYETGKKFKFFKPMVGFGGDGEMGRFDVDVVDCEPEKVLCGRDGKFKITVQDYCSFSSASMTFVR